MLKLVNLKKEDYEEYKKMIQEWKESGTTFVPDFLELPCNTEEDFMFIIDVIEKASLGIHEDLDYYEKCYYHLVKETNHNQIIGAVALRENMTKLGETTLGNIAIGVRPSCRKLGYATELIQMLLEEARGLGMKEITACHYEENEISPKLLVAIHACYEGSIISTVSGKKIKRYRIEL